MLASNHWCLLAKAAIAAVVSIGNRHARAKFCPHSEQKRMEAAHLLRGYRGVRPSLSVFGRWKVVEYRGFRSFLKLLLDTAFSAFCALALSPPAPRHSASSHPPRTS